MCILTIIIPYKNTANCLKRLLESVLNETDTNTVEIIVVNDQSTLNMAEYQLLVQQFHKLVKFIDNTTDVSNAGVARNIGLCRATGEWVLFADSDDYFVNGWFAIVNHYFQSKYDIIYFTPTSSDESGQRISTRHLEMANVIDDFLIHKNRTAEDNLRFSVTVPWSKLFRRDLISKNKIEFDEVMYANDNLFSIKCGNCAKSIYATREVIYCVVNKKDSLTTVKTVESLYIRAQVHCNRYNYIKQSIGQKRFNKLPISLLWYITIIKAILLKMGGKCSNRDISRIINLFQKNRISPLVNPIMVGNYILNHMKQKRMLGSLCAHPILILTIIL